MKQLIKIPLLLTQITNFINLQQPNIEKNYYNNYNNLVVEKSYYESNTFQIAEATMKVEQNNITLGQKDTNNNAYINIQLTKFIIQPNKTIQNNTFHLEFTQKNFYTYTTDYLEESKIGYCFSTQDISNDYRQFPTNKLQDAFYDNPSWVIEEITEENNFNELISRMQVGFAPPSANITPQKNYKIQGILTEQAEENRSTQFTDGYFKGQAIECELYAIPSQTFYLYVYNVNYILQSNEDSINLEYVNWIRGSSEYDGTITTTKDIVDIPTLMFTILTLPFTFISQAFNLTLFPNTAYALNVSNLFLTIIGTIIFITIFVMVIKIIKK